VPLACMAMREFDDLEASLDAAAAAALSAELDHEVRDFVEADHATWTLAQRLRVMSRASEAVEFQLTGEHRIRGWVIDVGDDHVELAATNDRIATHAVVSLENVILATGMATAAARVEPPLGTSIGACLRHLQEQSPDVIALMAAGRSVAGVLLSVHRDHCDLAVASGRLAVPYSAVSGWLAAG
jgi:hypothetical protein